MLKTKTSAEIYRDISEALDNPESEYTRFLLKKKWIEVDDSDE